MALSLAMIKIGIKPPKVWHTFGGFALSSDMDLFYLFAYRHYSICKSQMQYALKADLFYVIIYTYIINEPVLLYLYRCQKRPCGWKDRKYRTYGDFWWEIFSFFEIINKIALFVWNIVVNLWAKIYCLKTAVRYNTVANYNFC